MNTRDDDEEFGVICNLCMSCLGIRQGPKQLRAASLTWSRVRPRPVPPFAHLMLILHKNIFVFLCESLGDRLRARSSARILSSGRSRV